LFGIPARKDELGSEAWAPDGIVPRAVRAVKDTVPDLMVITDVCVDEYTTHGHCGIVKDGQVVNDETLACLQKMALSHARAGPAVFGCRPCGAAGLQPSDRRVPGERGVQHDQGSRSAWMAGRTAGHARDLAGHPSSRRRPDPDLFCQGSRPGLARMRVLERLQ